MKRWAVMVGLLVAVGIGWGCTSRDALLNRPGRVLVLGIDGATWEIATPLMETGQLPHLKKLYDEGLNGVLESRPPILSPVVWTTIFTGFDYQTHGVKDWKTSQSTNRRVSAIWEITRKKKKKTNVFNVPGSWPPEAVDGVMMSGFPLSGATFADNTGEVLTSDKIASGRIVTPYRDNIEEIKSRTAGLAVGQWTPWFNGTVASRPSFKGVMRAMRLASDKIYVSPLYRIDDGLVVSSPRGLRAKISERLGEPYIPEGPGWSRYADEETPVYLYEHLKQVFDIQTRAALLYAGGNWDLSIYVMTLVDRVSHPYWAYSHPDDYPEIDRKKARHYEGAVAQSYRDSDEALGKMLAAAKGTFHVMIVSDHGFASYSDQTKLVGAHDPDGIYVVWGPGIKPAEGKRAYIEDVTPTVLYMMGLPVGRDMTGKAIAEVTADLGRPVQTVASYEPDKRKGSDVPVDDSTWEQLRGLGYVDGAPPRAQQQPKNGDKANGAQPPATLGGAKPQGAPQGGKPAPQAPAAQAGGKPEGAPQGSKQPGASAAPKQADKPAPQDSGN